MATIFAESKKLMTLPSIWIACASTLGLGISVTLVLSKRSKDVLLVHGDVGALLMVPDYVLYGVLVIGVLGAVTEYQGGQVYTSMTAVPDRVKLGAAKGVVVGFLAAGVSIATMSASALAAHLGPVEEVWPVVMRSCIYLSVMALLAFSLGLMLRSLVPALVVSLCMLVVCPTVLAPITSLGKWAPSSLGSDLFVTIRAPADWKTKMLVLVLWVMSIGGCGYARFVNDDG
ncbi:hypothetical protein [Actinomyces qiguomingii]|uniref:hypothetical protein n=1 Tax=Actinomyces qiguomingii TaxID=2057800 RepID=UPI000CA059A7|nr:hypothetical protein [Actinomyces qiguomingii]